MLNTWHVSQWKKCSCQQVRFTKVTSDKSFFVKWSLESFLSKSSQVPSQKLATRVWLESDSASQVSNTGVSCRSCSRSNEGRRNIWSNGYNPLKRGVLKLYVKSNWARCVLTPVPRKFIFVRRDHLYFSYELSPGNVTFHVMICGKLSHNCLRFNFEVDEMFQFNYNCMKWNKNLFGDGPCRLGRSIFGSRWNIHMANIDLANVQHPPFTMDIDNFEKLELSPANVNLHFS